MKNGKNNLAVKNERKWYALYVNVKHEKIVMQKLLEKGMEAYVPIVKQMKQWSDRKKLIDTPLFTGYVFVKIFPSEMEKPRWVSGVINFLKFENKPAVIRDVEIDALKYFVNKGYSLEVEKNIVLTGQKVKINLSQFKDFTGVVENISDNDYVMVSFEGIGKNLIIKAPIGALKPIAGN